MSWLDGYGQQRPQVKRQDQPPDKIYDRPAKPISKSADATWRRGDRTVRVPVACCPECGSTEVKIRTSSGSLVKMECGECGESWRDNRANMLSHKNASRRKVSLDKRAN